MLSLPGTSERRLLLMHLSACLTDVSFPSDGRTGAGFGAVAFLLAQLGHQNWIAAS